MDQIQIVFHLTNKKNTKFHIEYWSTLLDKYRNKIIFLIRDKKTYQNINTLFTNLNIYYAKTPIDVENFISLHKNVSTVFYTSNTIKNIHTIRFINLKHIFITPIHIINFNKSFRAYDEIWFPSKFIENRFLETLNKHHLKLSIIGFNHLNNYNSQKKQKNIIFFSKKNNFLNSFIFLKKLIKKENIFFFIRTKDIIKKLKFHIFIKNYVTLFSEKQNIYKYLEEGKILITDKRSFTLDFLFYNIPILIKGDISHLSPILQEITYTFQTNTDLKKLIQEVEKNDYKRSNREKFINYFTGKNQIENKSLTKKIEDIIKI